LEGQGVNSSGSEIGGNREYVSFKRRGGERGSIFADHEFKALKKQAWELTFGGREKVN